METSFHTNTSLLTSFTKKIDSLPADFDAQEDNQKIETLQIKIEQITKNILEMMCSYKQFYADMFENNKKTLKKNIKGKEIIKMSEQKVSEKQRNEVSAFFQNHILSLENVFCQKVTENFHSLEQAFRYNQNFYLEGKKSFLDFQQNEKLKFIFNFEKLSCNLVGTRNVINIPPYSSFEPVTMSDLGYRNLSSHIYVKEQWIEMGISQKEYRKIYPYTKMRQELEKQNPIIFDSLESFEKRKEIHQKDFSSQELEGHRVYLIEDRFCAFKMQQTFVVKQGAIDFIADSNQWGISASLHYLMEQTYLTVADDDAIACMTISQLNASKNASGYFKQAQKIFHSILSDLKENICFLNDLKILQKQIQEKRSFCLTTALSTNLTIEEAKCYAQNQPETKSKTKAKKEKKRDLQKSKTQNSSTSLTVDPISIEDQKQKDLLIQTVIKNCKPKDLERLQAILMRDFKKKITWKQVTKLLSKLQFSIQPLTGSIYRFSFHHVELLSRNEEEFVKCLDLLTSNIDSLTKLNVHMPHGKEKGASVPLCPGRIKSFADLLEKVGITLELIKCISQ